MANDTDKDPRIIAAIERFRNRLSEINRGLPPDAQSKIAEARMRIRQLVALYGPPGEYAAMAEGVEYTIKRLKNQA